MQPTDHPRSEPNMLNPLRIRKLLGRASYMPPQPYGDGWYFDTYGEHDYIRVLVSPWIEPDGVEWIHASISRSDGSMPTYDNMVSLHRACFTDERGCLGYAYQVFAPPQRHININPNVLHLWGRRDGQAGLPDFGRFGTI